VDQPATPTTPGVSQSETSLILRPGHGPVGRWRPCAPAAAAGGGQFDDAAGRPEKAQDAPPPLRLLGVICAPSCFGLLLAKDRATDLSIPTWPRGVTDVTDTRERRTRMDQVVGTLPGLPVPGVCNVVLGVSVEALFEVYARDFAADWSGWSDHSRSRRM
jgi:hypothetical protein